MRSRFVEPDTTTLKISERRHAHRQAPAEYRRAARRARAMTSAPEPGETGVRANPFEIGISMVLAYLVDWSLTDGDGRHVDIRGKPREDVRAMLDNLDPLDFDEIRLAIDAHVEARGRAA